MDWIDDEKANPLRPVAPIAPDLDVTVRLSLVSSPTSSHAGPPAPAAPPPLADCWLDAASFGGAAHARQLCLRVVRNVRGSHADSGNGGRPRPFRSSAEPPRERWTSIHSSASTNGAKTSTGQSAACDVAAAVESNDGGHGAAVVARNAEMRSPAPR